ncbi:MAG: hypothetical protein J6U86_00600 [Clostridia bacterium]|nr:hypothetical protein [Clostridia bacterium]
MTEQDAKRFEQLCRYDLLLHGSDADGIGTYNEKRIHRILKRFITENAECYEIKIGKYFADVVKSDGIFEIQTGSFRSLTNKVEFYLQNTDMNVYIIHPIISEKRIIRAERDTGEVLKVSRSPKKGRPQDALAELYHIGKYVSNDRLYVCLLYIEGEEYRYSEAQRYRRKGRYDNDFRPTAITGITVLRSTEDWRSLLPNVEGEFTAADFERAVRLHGRKRYYALSALCDMGMISRRTEGKRHYYSMT